MIHKDDGNLHALAQYEAQQDKLEVTRRELEAAQVRALVETLETVGSSRLVYSGAQLVSEAMSEHYTGAFQPIAAFLAHEAKGYDCLSDALPKFNHEALGKLVLGLIWPYLTDYAEKNADDYLPSVDGPEREG